MVKYLSILCHPTYIAYAQVITVVISVSTSACMSLDCWQKSVHTIAPPYAYVCVQVLISKRCACARVHTNSTLMHLLVPAHAAPRMGVLHIHLMTSRWRQPLYTALGTWCWATDTPCTYRSVLPGSCLIPLDYKDYTIHICGTRLE